VAAAFSPAGRHAVVTGGSRGIGVALAAELADRGARVTLVARPSPELHDVAKRVGGVAVECDLADRQQRDALVGRFEEAGGPVDLLINNAAVAVVAPVIDQTSADVTHSFELNTLTPIDLIRRLLPGMLERRRGAIACISSLAGVTAIPTLATYGATKAGLVHFSAALQREVRRTPVRVTIVQLGEVSGTDMMERARRSPTIAAVSTRLARTHALPVITAEQVARSVIDGVVRGRRAVIVPRRISCVHAIRELPSRLNDLILLGIE
jgi:3-dehydrosphinganine reductase